MNAFVDSYEAGSGNDETSLPSAMKKKRKSNSVKISEQKVL